MNNKGRSNALLIELLVVIMFFMLAATVIVQIFAKAHELRERSVLETDALLFAQNTADALYAGDDAQAVLSSLDFSAAGENLWEKTVESRTFSFDAQVRIDDREREDGTLSEMEITIFRDGAELFTLPCVRYREEGA